MPRLFPSLPVDSCWVLAAFCSWASPAGKQRCIRENAAYQQPRFLARRVDRVMHAAHTTGNDPTLKKQRLAGGKIVEDAGVAVVVARLGAIGVEHGEAIEPTVQREVV